MKNNTIKLIKKVLDAKIIVDDYIRVNQFEFDNYSDNEYLEMIKQQFNGEINYKMF